MNMHLDSQAALVKPQIGLAQKKTPMKNLLSKLEDLAQVDKLE